MRHRRHRSRRSARLRGEGREGGAVRILDFWRRIWWYCRDAPRHVAASLSLDVSFFDAQRGLFVLSGTKKQLRSWGRGAAFYGYYCRCCVFLHACPFALKESTGITLNVVEQVAEKLRQKSYQLGIKSLGSQSEFLNGDDPRPETYRELFPDFPKAFELPKVQRAYE